MPNPDWIPAASEYPRELVISAEVLRDMAEIQDRACDNIPVEYTQAEVEAASIRQLQELKAAKELELERSANRERQRKWRAEHPATDEIRKQTAARVRKHRKRIEPVT